MAKHCNLMLASQTTIKSGKIRQMVCFSFAISSWSVKYAYMINMIWPFMPVNPRINSTLIIL